MSYYNFNDHFWSSKTVCPQKPIQTNDADSKAKTSSYIICIASTLISLLFAAFFMGNHKNQTGDIRNINNSNCLMLTRNQEMQLYCSNLQR
ncbi:hypothetical protein [Nostoc parmelioides]|uniref:Uncharacterized protein n=1 Tax=Nostoc parmelioides FACHB-3921 TaxID=2692909 RepID=A0ABR8BCK6_9NOSO|nr:hypothetical protein [Nostoc parmelioides]MBD2251454.1 hypothetical protein [Nostoc parmelioides FACHB-3921]